MNEVVNDCVCAGSLLPVFAVPDGVSKPVRRREDSAWKPEDTYDAVLSDGSHFVPVSWDRLQTRGLLFERLTYTALKQFFYKCVEHHQISIFNNELTLKCLLLCLLASGVCGGGGAVSPVGVAPTRTVGTSVSIIFPCSIKIQKTGGEETQPKRSTAPC